MNFVSNRIKVVGKVTNLYKVNLGRVKSSTIRSVNDYLCNSHIDKIESACCTHHSTRALCRHIDPVQVCRNSLESQSGFAVGSSLPPTTGTSVAHALHQDLNQAEPSIR